MREMRDIPSIDDVIPTTASDEECAMISSYGVPKDTINTEMLKEAAARLKPDSLSVCPALVRSSPSSSTKPPGSPTIIVSPPEEDLENGHLPIYDPHLKDPDCPRVQTTSGRGSLLLASAIALIVLLTVLFIIILAADFERDEEKA
ncbi:unnamed protein product, partial [Mesorhabditis belari]|uniref:LEM domain-containing protein n=1 Tax=Mesorhabditis belari TaxID=2138241 RepID=A0AAF3FRW2_9BILA